jgi:hypothetical protein
MLVNQISFFSGLRMSWSVEAGSLDAVNVIPPESIAMGDGEDSNPHDKKACVTATAQLVP